MTESSSQGLSATMVRERPDAPDDQSRTIEWLESEFPAWTVTIAVTSGWDGVTRPLWEANQIGHHPQRELTAGKLHRRLDDYEDRDRRRRPLGR